MYVTQRSVVVYRHVRENTHALMKRRLSVMKMLLSVTHPPSSVALHADTATPSGSGVQASVVSCGGSSERSIQPTAPNVLDWPRDTAHGFHSLHRRGW